MHVAVKRGIADSCLLVSAVYPHDRITSYNLTISGMLSLSISFLAYGVAERSLLRQLHLYGNLELAVEMAVWMNNLKRRLQSQLSSGYCYTCANIRMYVRNISEVKQRENNFAAMSTPTFSCSQCQNCLFEPRNCQFARLIS